MRICIEIYHAFRFFLGLGVRIDHVIRSHSALPFSSLSLPLAPAEDVPRAVILLVLVVTNFRAGVFSSVFGLSRLVG